MPKHSAPFRCTFAGCNYSFTRRQHLERHRTAHTKQQRFTCPDCLRPFSRLDSLQRHTLRLHVNRSSPAAEQNVAASSCPSPTSTVASPSTLPSASIPSAPSITTSTTLTVSTSAAPGFSGQSNATRWFSPPCSNTLAPSTHAGPTFELPDFDSILLTDLFNDSLYPLVQQDNPSPAHIPPDWSQSFLHWMNRTTTSDSGSRKITDSPPDRLVSESPSLLHDGAVGMTRDTEPAVGVRSRAPSPFLETLHEDGIPSLSDHQSQILRWMLTDVQRTLHRLCPPPGPSQVLANTCLWLLRRHLVPWTMGFDWTRFLNRCGRQPALATTLIALGSLWHTDEDSRNLGKQLWHFTVRIVMTRSWRMTDSDEALRDFLIICFFSHCFFRMCGDPHVFEIGRPAWMLAHSYAKEICGQIESNTMTWPSIDGLDRLSPQDLEIAWHNWHYQEDKKRILLGLNVHDGQQSLHQLSPPTLFQHVSQIMEPAPEDLFNLRDAQAWREAYRSHLLQRRAPIPTIDAYLKRLFTPFVPTTLPEDEDEDFKALRLGLSTLSFFVLLEQIHSVHWYGEYPSAHGADLWFNRRGQAVWSEACYVHALCHWRSWHDQSVDYGPRLSAASHPSSYKAQRYGLVIRWHAICLSIATKQVDIATHLRSHIGPTPECPQYKIHRPNLSQTIDMANWIVSPLARRAVYHAGAILSLVLSTPRGDALAVHVVQAYVEAAMLLVYLFRTFQKAEQSNRGQFEVMIDPIRERRWESVGLAGFEPTTTALEWVQQDAAGPTWRWITSGATASACIYGLPLVEAAQALHEFVVVIEQADAKWCYLTDCVHLLRGNLTLD